MARYKSKINWTVQYDINDIVERVTPIGDLEYEQSKVDIKQPQKIVDAKVRALDDLEDIQIIFFESDPTEPFNAGDFKLSDKPYNAKKASKTVKKRKKSISVGGIGIDVFFKKDK